MNCLLRVSGRAAMSMLYALTEFPLTQHHSDSTESESP